MHDAHGHWPAVRFLLSWLAALAGCMAEATPPDTRAPDIPESAAAVAMSSTILRDDFESGGFTSAPWTVVGTASVRAEAARAARYGARLSAGASITATLDTSGQKDLTVSFQVRGMRLGRGEYVAVEWAPPGGAFTIVSRVDSSLWYGQEVPLPAEAQDLQGVQVRFSVRARASLFFKGAYLDDVLVAGTPEGGEPQCSTDADCASLSGPCGTGTCNVETGQCTATPRPAGTACGSGRVCDAAAHCVRCSGSAGSSYALIQSSIFDAPGHGCNGSVCHGGSPGQAQLDLRATSSYTQLVGRASTLSSLLRVQPGDAAQSFLYQKIAAGTLGTPVSAGDAMPTGGAPPVPERLLSGLRLWIDAGAPATGFPAGTIEALCDAPCQADAECDNANPCDGTERCQAGSCISGTPLSCDDAKPCTRDTCARETGCQNVITAGLSCEAGVCDEAGMCKPIDRPAGATGQLVQLWDFPLARSVTSTPLVVGDVVYVTAWDGILYALDRATGSERWRFNTQARALHAGATRAPDGSLLIGDGEAVVWRLSPSGEVIWQRDLDETQADHIWSNVTVHDGIVYVPIASHSDVPCTKGRTVALDLATGAPIWARYNVPRGGVCRTDTAVECTTSADCPGGGACEVARGGAVTAQVAVDPSGQSVYVNTVGCYTFPQIGDTDAMMKLNAKTGAVEWLQRFSESEQFGYCAGTGRNCRGDADCGGAARSCTPKMAFNDFGFINGPLLVDASDGAGGRRSLVVSGNKSGGLYALDARTGSQVWLRQVVPAPIAPRFAGYGLFNGALAYRDGTFFGALYEFAGGINPAPEHLMAFSEVDGATVWSDEIGKSWGSIAEQNGVLFMGTQERSELYSYDAKTGQRLGIFPLPALTAAKAAVDGDQLFLGYGVGTAGGVRAYRHR